MLHSRHRLFGNIEDIAVLRLPTAHRDSLVLTFADAKVKAIHAPPKVWGHNALRVFFVYVCFGFKVSVLDFDVQRHDITTKSLHFFEDNYLPVTLK
jgi:hypothetical protein